MSASLRPDALKAEHDRIAHEQHMDDLNGICPCNNDPYGNGPCEDCRDDIEKAKRRRAFALLK